MASKQLFQNRASSLLATTINAAATSFSVATGEGALFPNPGVNEFFLATLEDAAGATEVVKVTGRSTDTFTVVRGQEGTTAASWTQNVTRVELRTTKGTMERFLQRDGDEMTGPLDMNSQNVVDAVLTGSGTMMTAGEIVNVPIRGVTGGTANQLTVPVDGTSRAQAGGANIALQSEVNAILPIGSVIMWYGNILNIPSGWHECDGTSGTPDLRDKFVYGVSGTRALGTTGGGASGTSGADGTHTHTVGGTALTESQMPSHNHRLWAANTTSADIASLSAAITRGVAGDESGGGTAYLNYTGDNPSTGSKLIENSGSGATHTHTLTSDGSHTHTVPVLDPANVALYYIMRVS